MEYFLLKPDRKNKNVIQIDYSKKQIEEKQAQVVFADLEETKDRPDFMEIGSLTQKEYIVSTRMKDLLAVYADGMKFEPFILMDYDRKLQENYWKIHLESVEQAIIANNGLYDTPESMVLDESVIEEKYIFAVKKQKTFFWVASLFFLENFLRKNMLGIEWYPLHTVSGKELE